MCGNCTWIVFVISSKMRGIVRCNEWLPFAVRALRLHGPCDSALFRHKTVHKISGHGTVFYHCAGGSACSCDYLIRCRSSRVTRLRYNRCSLHLCDRASVCRIRQQRGNTCFSAGISRSIVSRPLAREGAFPSPNRHLI